MITYLFNVATEGRRIWTQESHASQPRGVAFTSVKFEDYLLLHSFFASNAAKLLASIEAEKVAINIVDYLFLLPPPVTILNLPLLDEA